MARISGVNVPTGKRVEIALTYIYGIGRSTASKIMDEAGIPKSRRVNDLTEVELDTLRDLSSKITTRIQISYLSLSFPLEFFRVLCQRSDR